ncbi:MAG: hypothetical protein PHG91_12505 [Syntrophales bacterium]|nr:hypothetical protein [Syntrophales bacterium]MDD5532071.1 hypothetical protein [Syntrophales bacterium]
MVKGLHIFRDHFAPFANQYVLIGGTACDLAMESAALQFRATKDLDIVLCVETISADFIRAFWDFVLTKGKYRIAETSTGQKRFYRFTNPEDKSFPVMLELFSRVPDLLTVRKGAHLTPIPMSEDLSSLSAILLDDDYYGFIHSSKQVIEGLSVVGPGCLIPLKAKAWLDLSRLREGGAQIHKADILKHRNDVFRLFPILDPEPKIALPSAVHSDFRDFLEIVEKEGSVDLKALGLKRFQLEEVLQDLRSIYGIS